SPMSGQSGGYNDHLCGRPYWRGLVAAASPAIRAKLGIGQRVPIRASICEAPGSSHLSAIAAIKAVTPANGKTGRRAKPKPKYQSKKNKSLKWTGRGVTPVWMREEMKG